MRTIGKTTTAMLAGAAALAVTTLVAFAEHHLQGTWAVEDTSGTPFDIVLSEDGTASANRSGEDMSGTWKEDGGVAVITWEDGWTTKIDGKSKKAWEKGAPLDGPPTNSSSATKKQ